LISQGIVKDDFSRKNNAKETRRKNWKTKPLVISIFAIFILLMNNAQLMGEITGVRAGDWVKYAVHKSHNPRTWIPEMHDAEWVLVNVTRTEGTQITIKEIIDKGPTRTKSFDIMYLEETTLRYIIPPNLTIGDKVMRIQASFENGSQKVIDLTIDRITNNTYGGVTREVIGVTYIWIEKEYISPNRIININCTLIVNWDRKTGFMLERTVIAKYQDTEYEPSMFSLRISDTNMWQWQSENDLVFTMVVKTIIIGSIVICSLGIIFWVLKNRRRASG